MKGIINTGRTCFINVALQVIFKILLFELEENDWPSHQFQSRDDQELIQATKTLFCDEAMHDVTNLQNFVCIIKKNVYKIGNEDETSQDPNRSQEDPIQFLEYFVNIFLSGGG